MKLTTSTLLAKLNALISCAALILFVVAFSSNYWLEKDFNFPVDAGGVATIPVEANIGLFTACNVEYYPNNRSSSTCSTKGVSEWNYIAMGLCIVELVLAVIGVVLAILATVTHRWANNLKVKLANVVCWFITCGFALGPLVMFLVNRKIQVRSNLSTFQVDFDLAWSYKVSAASAVLFAVLVLLNTADIIWSPNCDRIEVKKKDDRCAFSQNTNNGSWRR